MDGQFVRKSKKRRRRPRWPRQRLGTTHEAHADCPDQQHLAPNLLYFYRHLLKRGNMTKTAVGLFETSARAEAVVTLLLAAGFARDEVKLVKRTDFDSKPAPETDILQLGGAPAEHAGRYWDAVRGGRTLIVISAGDRADRAVEIMDAEGAVYLEESVVQPVSRAVRAVADDPGFYPRRGAAQMFEVS